MYDLRHTVAACATAAPRSSLGALHWFGFLARKRGDWRVVFFASSCVCGVLNIWLMTGELLGILCL